VNITRTDRLAFFGQTGSGKSELARAMFAGMATPRIVIDVKDDLAAKLPGIPTVQSPTEAMHHETVRAVPVEPSDEAWYAAIYDAALARGETLIWLDEANEVSNSNYIPRSIRRFILQGRSRQCGHFACSPRPADINPTFAAQSQHLFLFWVTHPRDIKAYSELSGRKESVIESILTQRIEGKETRRFLHLEQDTGELVVCPPAHDPDQLTASIAARYFSPGKPRLT
jgi:energy-coupling factor transporter ATP-binding protein EcfA2